MSENKKNELTADELGGIAGGTGDTDNSLEKPDMARCSVCGKMKFASALNDGICSSCQKPVDTTKGICSVCGNEAYAALMINGVCVLCRIPSTPQS